MNPPTRAPMMLPAVFAAAARPSARMRALAELRQPSPWQNGKAAPMSVLTGNMVSAQATKRTNSRFSKVLVSLYCAKLSK